jgi:hypothetical protein
MTLLPQSDHLILLVGGNPVPNAVAGRLLAVSGGVITLVHSCETAAGAQRLRTWLKAQGTAKVELKQVEESNPTSIFLGVWERLEIVKAQRVGLSYTGGTKAMSVHAYRAVEQWANAQRKQGKNAETVFSYLDARKLEMVFDPADPFSGEYGRREYVGLELPLTLTNLLEMHGWTFKKDDAPVRTATLPQSARTLIQVHTDKVEAKQWNDWIKEKLEPHTRKSMSEWRNEELRNKTLDWILCDPDSKLARFIDMFTDETGASNTQQLDFGAPKDKGHFAKIKHVPAWLHGKWLEHYVLDVLNGLAESLCLHECVQNIVPNEVEFDVDVIALRGYQLFAFSCSTDSGKGLLKSKLFECFARTRQVGGDEARTALVCCSDSPEKLEEEMRNIGVSEGHIRVFGRKHLADLATHLTKWIQDQSKGAGDH